jgi:hypothetical protein
MAMTLITTNTSSGASNSAFTSSIDSTYKLYIIKWYAIHGSEDYASFTFNGSIDSGSNYNVTKTTTMVLAAHQESDNSYLTYDASRDIAEGTGYQILNYQLDGASSDGSSAGELFLFNPSSTTYVKHFYGTTNYMYYDVSSTYCNTNYYAGYFNTTDNIDALNFQMDSGTFDGTIKMYGVG